MAIDRSLFHYGTLYHRLLDPLILPARNMIIDRIPENSSVIDIGCGTGALCLDLRREKKCPVVGIDLSRKMLDFAQSRNTYDDVLFQHLDASDLSEFSEGSFEYAIIMNVIHEMDPELQIKVVVEACRVAKNVMIYDSNVPLPWNLTGIMKRAIEVTFGFDHYPQFQKFIDQSGIVGILAASGLSSQVRETEVCFQGCNLLLTLAC